MWCDGFCGALINILLIIFVVIALHYVYLLWNSDYWKKRGVFCPDSKALFGNLPGQVTGKRNIVYDMDDLYQQYKEKYSYIGIYQFRQPRLLVFDPVVIKDIMIKYFKYFQGTEFYGKIDQKSDPLFGNHSFVLVGDEWKAKRAEMTPGFTNSRIKAIFPIIQEVNAKLVKYIKSEIAKDSFNGLDAKDLAARFTISVVSNSIYNIDSRSFESEEPEILKTSQAITAPTKRFMIATLLTTIYPFLSSVLKIKFGQTGSEEFFINLMKQAIKHREANNIQRLDYLDHLMTLKNKKEISDMDMAGHGVSFLIDGFDTSSSAISGTLYELAANLDIQKKLRDEIAKAMPKEEDFTYDNVMNLPYLDQVFHESLRLHFPGTHFSRLCNEPIEVDLPKDKKLYFEKNSIILFPVISLHKDPEYYPDPEKFDPDRFSPENGGAKAFIERGIFLPFGIGPRVCPGSRLAVAQLKLVVANLIKNFEITVNSRSPKEIVIHPQAMLLSLAGFYLNFKEIK